eukprot:m.707459 g.707459  ORF g.707459 m.707459 type:complete len:1226 (-) comp58730_c0_seq11:17-3694(-)
MYQCLGERYVRSDVGGNGDCWTLPDTMSLVQFSEIFATPELTGIIYTETSLSALKAHRSRRTYQQTVDSIADSRHQSAFFSNEHCLATYSPRVAGESQLQYSQRLLFRAALWYSNHEHPLLPLTETTIPSSPAGEVPAASQRTIVITTDDTNFQRVFGALCSGVRLVGVRQYLQQYWAHLDIFPFFESLSAAQLAITPLVAADPASSSDVDEEACESEGSLWPTVSDLTGFRAYRPRGGLLAGVKSGLYIRGALFVDSRMPDRATVKSSDCLDEKLLQSSDVLVLGHLDRNRAVNGDIVVVQLHPQDRWARASPGSSDDHRLLRTGFVIGVLHRRWRDYVATIQEESKPLNHGPVLCVPMDQRVPAIQVTLHDTAAQMNNRLVVRIDDWPASSPHPIGHFVRSLGRIGERLTETRSLLVEHDIQVPEFSSAQLREMPVDTAATPWSPSEDEEKHRLDIRQSHLVFTIDPIGCEDVDDALCVRTLPNGEIELSVHIADVSYFVKPKMLTDEEARRRGTTIYLADRRYDMLPAILSSNICSLLGNVDRYAVSVFWRFDASMKILGVWFGRTIICSRYKLHYEFAQAVFDGLSAAEIVAEIPTLQRLSPKDTAAKVAELREAVKLLVETARKLSARRLESGALQLSGQELEIELDEAKQNVKGLQQSKHIEMHDTVAECMIFANQAVAERISSVFSSRALLRNHPLPEKMNFEALIELAHSKGFPIDPSSNFTLAESIARCVDPSDPTFQVMIRSLATRAMSEAKYICTGSINPAEWFHYGLCLNHYTHFTSPIRRYADLAVHRQLIASLAVKPNPRNMNYLLPRRLTNQKANHVVSERLLGHASKLALAPHDPLEDDGDDDSARLAAKGLVLSDLEQFPALPNRPKPVKVVAPTTMASKLAASLPSKHKVQDFAIPPASVWTTAPTASAVSVEPQLEVVEVASAAPTEGSASSKQAKPKSQIPDHWVDKLETTKELQTLCDHINMKNRESKYAQRESDELFQTYYFATKQDDLNACAVEGVIVQLRGQELVCMIPSLNQRGNVRIASDDGHSLLAAGLLNPALRSTRAKAHALISGLPIERTKYSVMVCGPDAASPITLRLFDHVLLHVTVNESRYKFQTLGFVLMGLWPQPAGTRPVATPASGEATVRATHQTPPAASGSSVPFGTEKITIIPPKPLAQVLDVLDDTRQLKRLYGQARATNSLYASLQRYEDLGLLLDGDDEDAFK